MPDVLDPLHCIHLENGRFSNKTETKLADIALMLAAAQQANPANGILIHCHGGLNSLATAKKIIARLTPQYAQSSTYPVFFAWETGAFETIINNLRDITKEKAFREILRKVIEFTLKQVGGLLGLKGGPATPISPMSVKFEVDAWFEGRRDEPPYRDTVVLNEPGMKAATFDEDALTLAIRANVAKDLELKAAVQQLTTAPETVMPDEAIATITTPPPPGGKGIMSTLKLAKAIAEIVIRVVKRFRSGRDHGLFATAEEEVLRQFYVALIGQDFFWGQMKKDALDAFDADQTPGKECGGTALVAALVAAMPFPRLTLVGHSAGTIKLCHFVHALCTLKPDVQLDLVLLAPAVDFGLFRRTMEQHSASIRAVRLFGMTDEVEREDEMAQGLEVGGVPVGKAIYPHSLLYFVSGLLEKEEVDLPILGMERYWKDKETYDAAGFPDVEWTRKAFANDDRFKAGWSVTDVPGLATASKTHGDFDNDPVTLQTVAGFIARV